MRETIVIGIGNIIRGDDGAGIHALRLLRERRGLPQQLQLIEGGTLGLELLPYLRDAGRIILLDAMDAGESPGTVFCLKAPNLMGLNGSWSVHQLGVADLITALRFIRDDEPDITIIGIQPGNTDWVTQLSPQVNAALNDVVELCLKQLH